MTQAIPRPPKELLPTMYDLPSEEVGQPGLPDEFHLLQPPLLSQTFQPEGIHTEQILTASDLNLYYDWQHPQWYKRPDWYAVVGVPHLYRQQVLRQSYVVWQEEVIPKVMIELLSPSTRKDDLGSRERKGEIPTKWEVYEQILQIPYYLVFDAERNLLRVFECQQGRYHRVTVSKSDPRYWIEELGIGLGLWFGYWEKLERKWLRWYDRNGNWILTPAEKEIEAERQKTFIAQQETSIAKQETSVAKQEASVAKQEASVAKQEASAAKQEASVAKQEIIAAQERTERLAQRLRDLGLDPDHL